MKKTEAGVSGAPLPCPFCGGRAKREMECLDERFAYADRITYRCTCCGVKVSAMGDTSKGGYADNSKVEQRALSAWNRRAKSPAASSGD